MDSSDIVSKPSPPQSPARPLGKYGRPEQLRRSANRDTEVMKQTWGGTFSEGNALSFSELVPGDAVPSAHHVDKRRQKRKGVEVLFDPAAHKCVVLGPLGFLLEVALALNHMPGRTALVTAGNL